MSHLVKHSPSSLTRVILIAIFTATYLYLDFLSPKITPNQVETSLGITDEYDVPADSHTYHLSGGDNTITLFPIPQAGNFRLTFYYLCTTTCPELWLQLPDQNLIGQVEILVDHPVFSLLPMNYLTDNIFSLYQPNIHFTSLPQFLASFPNDPIYSEPHIIGRFISAQNNVVPLKNYLPQKRSYIFTTYTKPRIFGDFLEFSRFHSLPASSAFRPLNATISAIFHSAYQPVTVKVPLPSAMINP